MLSGRSNSSGVNPFGNRRGAGVYGSSRFHTSPRLRKQHFLSFRNTRRQTPQTQRTQEVFDKLLKGLDEGISGLKEYCQAKRKEIPSSLDGLAGTKLMNHYMDMEKMVKALERRVRTVEVHKDKVEEMKDEYEIKLKLREGAFNLAAALSSQEGKASKEKLAEARAEQKDLLEDLCDIEDELETKLGVFRVNVRGFTGPTKLSNGDNYELQLKLANQKWKARCRVEKHEQLWQDNDIIFIGRIMDELLLKLVEAKRMQADNSVGTAKWRSREMFSFFPQNVRVNFPTSSGMLHLWLEVKWSPTIEDDFLSDLDLPAVELVVGASKRGRHSSGVVKSSGESSGTLVSRSGSLLSVRKVIDMEVGVFHTPANANALAFSDPKPCAILDIQDDRHHGLSRVLHSASSAGALIDTPSSQERKVVAQPQQNGSSRIVITKNGSASDHLPTKAVRKQPSEPMLLGYSPDVVARSNTEQMGSPRVLTSHPRTKRKTSAPAVSAKRSPPPNARETPSPTHQAPPTLAQPLLEGSADRRGSLGTKQSYEEAISFRSALSSSPSVDYPSSLVSAMEAVNISLEEPKVVYADLRALEFQMMRLERFLRGAKIRRTTSMTLSESMALDSFNFLSSDEDSEPNSQPQTTANTLIGDAACHHGDDVAIDDREESGLGSLEGTGSSKGTTTSLDRHAQVASDSQCSHLTSDSALGSEGSVTGSRQVKDGVDDLPLPTDATTGVSTIDTTLTQHLVYADHLLQELLQQSFGFVGPLNFKLRRSLTKLRKEAETIKELLNMVANVYEPPNLEEVLPDLAANKPLIHFWRQTAGADSLLCVRCDSFVVAVDHKFGAAVWRDYPDIAIKVFPVLLNRILDLEYETGDLADTKMVVTVFQYAAYFLEHSHQGIEAHLLHLAKELQFTEGASCQDPAVRARTAHKLDGAAFDHGALFAVAMLLSEDNPTTKTACLRYLDRLLDTPVWHRDAISYLIDLLENNDQCVRSGACLALGRVKGVEAIPQLKYLAKVDFAQVQACATKALGQLGCSSNQLASSQSDASTEDPPFSHPPTRTKSKSRPPHTKAAMSMRSRSAPAAARLKANRKSAPHLESNREAKELLTTHV